MASAVRALSLQAISKAKSGHPGLPTGAADIATVLFSRFLKFDPRNPDWPDRDRFVLSGGHGSILLYSLTHLLGYSAMTMQEIERFRCLGGRTPGHPERDVASGVEATTGPLGQGFANVVGMALAERMLRARFGADMVDHYTYALAGDGCLMEGVSYEAAAFAGNQGLDRLIILFDDNGITIDGSTSLVSCEDEGMRFKACGWDVFSCDGHDPDAIAAAIEEAKASPRPAIVACKTRIGYAIPGKEGTAAAHGGAPSDQEVAGALETLGWTSPPFTVPDEIVEAWRAVGARSAADFDAWKKRLGQAEPSRRAEFEAWQAGELPEGWESPLHVRKKEICEARVTEPTRISSKKALNALAPAIPNLIGGSADLTAPCLSLADGMEAVSRDNPLGRHIYFGVREHAMAAIANGIALHGGLLSYCATFLCFADYCRPALRLSALMKQKVIYLLTHDSINQGADGPTHQAVEHLAMLRATPGIKVFRPADGVEVVECWELAVRASGQPIALVMTRNDVPPVRTKATEENLCALGAYVLAEAEGEARVSFLATGSEVSVAMGARDILQAAGIPTRVVSMPCLELFEEQPEDFRERILGSDTFRVSIEAGSVFGWDRYVGPEGLRIGMTTFGGSGSTEELMDYFGFTPEKVAAAVKGRLGV